MNGIADNSFMYFVHSYYATLSAETIATTDYINPFSSAMHKNNFYGVQFHTEKSAVAGERILSNFLNII
jgi:glutamine amidotransferase